jgi:selenocysteine lyase/cysteine desulfurase
MDPALENLTDLARNNGYGHELLSKEFLLYDGLLNFNHGSFGTVPKVVMNRHVELLYEQESCPETWFRQTYFPYVNKSRKLVADLIHGCVEDVVLVENASTAVNAILRSFPFQSGDVVLVFSSAYRMVTETLLFQEFYQNVQTILVPIAYPVNGPEEMVQSFKTVIEEYGSRVKLCIFSHISSMVVLYFPFTFLLSF